MNRRAFTLIEALAVLLILIITVGVGYASLTSSTKSSYSQIAQGYTTEVVTAEQNFYNQYGTYTPYPGDLGGISAPLVVTNSSVTGANQVSIAVGQVTGELGLAYQDGSGACQIMVVTSLVKSTLSNPATSTTAVPSNTACIGSLALAADTPVVTTSGGSAK
jgi:type II secretory pathway pseudopilin PulG